MLLYDAAQAPRPTYKGLPPRIPTTAYPSTFGERYLNVPIRYPVSLYRSPVEGGLLAEWPGGTPVTMLGQRSFDNHTDWELARDPVGNEGWIAAVFLSEQYTAADPPTPADYDYLSGIWWEGEIAICANPAGGPPGLDGDDFVVLVEDAAARWQQAANGMLPLVWHGRCASSPDARDDRVNTVGWSDDLGFAIAGQAWPDADAGVVREIDIRLSRGFFQRLVARDPSKSLRGCVLSTLVHELGHLLGLDHPGSRALPSSMQGVGASQCDKSQPTESDRANLLRRYGSD